MRGATNIYEMFEHLQTEEEERESKDNSQGLSALKMMEKGPSFKSYDNYQVKQNHSTKNSKIPRKIVDRKKSEAIKGVNNDLGITIGTEIFDV